MNGNQQAHRNTFGDTPFKGMWRFKNLSSATEAFQVPPNFLNADLLEVCNISFGFPGMCLSSQYSSVVQC